jgi:hypothetical protein
MTKRAQRASGAEALLKAREAAATELKLPVEDMRVRRYALLCASYERLEALWGSGADIALTAS